VALGLFYNLELHDAIRRNVHTDQIGVTVKDTNSVLGRNSIRIYYTEFLQSASFLTLKIYHS
jgi:hypothetical protein